MMVAGKLMGWSRCSFFSPRLFPQRKFDAQIFNNICQTLSRRAQGVWAGIAQLFEGLLCAWQLTGLHVAQSVGPGLLCSRGSVLLPMLLARPWPGQGELGEAGGPIDPLESWHAAVPVGLGEDFGARGSV
jgi:hypothetical protein